MPTKRTILLGDYDTAKNGWTLASWTLGEPELLTNWLNVPGRFKGPLNLSNVLTGGLPTYGTRPLEIKLESSTGTRLERETKISELINRFHGQQVNVKIPDKSLYYLVAQLTVARDYNDPAHGAVTITGTCEPWLYSSLSLPTYVKALPSGVTLTLTNKGVMPVVPELKAEGPITIQYGGSSFTMETAGTYKWPELLLTPGSHEITVTGDNKTLTISYGEAVLR